MLFLAIHVLVCEVKNFVKRKCDLMEARRRKDGLIWPIGKLPGVEITDHDILCEFAEAASFFRD